MRLSDIFILVLVVNACRNIDVFSYITDFEYDFVRDALKKIRAGAETLDVAAYRAEWKPKEKD